MRNLSEHFTIDEFTKSSTADKLGIKNEIPNTLIPNAKRLCSTLGELIRTVLKRPVSLNSGYRNPKLNAEVGGSKTSDHMRGCAMDIRTDRSFSVSKQEQKLVLEYFRLNRADIEFNQLILYWNKGQRFLHISVAENGKGKREILLAYPKNKYVEIDYNKSYL